MSDDKPERVLEEEWRKCSLHPDVNPATMWGCPDCLAELRRAKLEDARDAARYRWLQSQGCGNAYGKVGTDEDCYLQLSPQDMDAAIDAAIEAALSREEPER